MHSADQIDQLNALRFEMQSGKFNLSRSNSEKISENEIPGMRNEIPKEETRAKYGDAAMEVEIGAIGKRGAFRRIPFAGMPDGGL